jgi:hypothetical protein
MGAGAVGPETPRSRGALVTWTRCRSRVGELPASQPGRRRGNIPEPLRCTGPRGRGDSGRRRTEGEGPADRARTPTAPAPSPSETLGTCCVCPEPVSPATPSSPRAVPPPDSGPDTPSAGRGHHPPVRHRHDRARPRAEPSD